MSDFTWQSSVLLDLTGPVPHGNEWVVESAVSTATVYFRYEAMWVEFALITC